MKQILVRITPELARSLERIAPGRGRKRSEFIRHAIMKALMEAEDVRTEDAYRRSPQESIALDAAAWAPDGEAVHFSEEEVRRMSRRASSPGRARPAKRTRGRGRAR